MGESAEHADVEAMLDKVALAMADGDNKEAMRLLPEIMASGDDIQRQMAESYQMQLAVLIEMEAETNELAELIDDNAEDSDTVAAERSLPVEDQAAEQVTAVMSDDTAADSLSDGQAEFDTQQHDAAVSENDDSQTNVDQSIEVPIDTMEDAVEDSTSASEASEVADALSPSPEAQITTISSVAQQIDTTEQIPLSAETAENEVDALFETALQMAEPIVEQDELSVSPDDTPTIDTPDNQQVSEVDLTLDQVAALLSDGEYESASMLLDSVLTDGNDLQRQMAETYAQQIAVLAATREQDIAAETEENDSLQATAVQQDAAAVQALSAQDSDDILTSLVADSFDKEEDVSDLQSPTQALNAFDLSSEHLLPQYREHSDQGERFQRQAFFIGDVGLMVAFADGSELTEMPTYYPVPNTPDWLVGLTNLHGVIIPIFDLVRFWGLPENNSGKPMLLVLQHQENAIGVIINGLPKRLTWVESQKVEKNTSPPRLSKHISAAYLIDEQLWFDLDSVALTGDLEYSMSH